MAFEDHPDEQGTAAPTQESDPESGLCTHQILMRRVGGDIEPSSVCSCPGGLVHMLDCPVEMGLGCRHFEPWPDELNEADGPSEPDGRPEPDEVSETPDAEHVEVPAPAPPDPTSDSAKPEILDEREFEELRGRLMQDYLSRSYHHRILALAPEKNAYEALCDEREAAYADFADDENAGGFDEEKYLREKEQLFEQRRRREQLRKEREDASREAKAQERARLGIKTAVERAREVVAETGNVASSVVDGVELEKTKRSPRRGRRRGRRRTDGDASGPPRRRGSGGGEGRSPAGGGEGSGGEGKPKRRRRRRPRKKKPGGDAG